MERMENNEKNWYRILEEFSAYYFDENPKVSQEFCLKMMIGQEELNVWGLLHYIAMVQDNFLVSFACLSFFHKLLDYSWNKRANYFWELFCKIDVQFIWEIGLDMHILAGAENDNLGIKVLDIYLKGHPNPQSKQIPVPQLPAVAIKN